MNVEERILGQHRKLLYWTYVRDLKTHGKRGLYGWHATNIELHVIAVCLVYAILRAFFEPVPSGIGAALFASHPMATAAVASISGRSSLLCGVFYLGGITAALIGGPAWLLVPVFFYCGWLSKQEILMLPITIMLMLWSIH